MLIRYLKKKVVGLIQKIGLGKEKSLFKFEDRAIPVFCEEDFQMECGCKMIFIDGMMSDKELEEFYKGREDQLYCEKHRAEKTKLKSVFFSGSQ